MQDINQFIITGDIEDISYDNRGWAIIKINSKRQTKDKLETHMISCVIWGEKLGDIKVSNKVIIQGYLTGRKVQKKDGGEFIAESRMILNIKCIGGKEIQDHQVASDDEIPF